MMANVLYMCAVVGAVCCLCVLGLFMIAAWTEGRRWVRRQK